MTIGDHRSPEVPRSPTRRGPLLRAGERVAAGYVVERYLGEGAFAEVYRVRHRFLGRQAMKVFKWTGSATAIENMLTEAVLLSRLGHPNIIRVFDAGTVATPSGERGYFTMEYVAGGTLERFRTRAEEGGRYVAVDDTVRILRQVSAGLAVAHAAQRPVIHRDITTHNILIGYDADGLRARLADFGLATSTHPTTGPADARGTVLFKPPETLLGLRGDLPTGDVWALGVVGYLLLTGRLPYPKGLAGWVSGTYRRAPPDSPRALNPDVDEGLEQIVLNALQVDRERRTPDAGALAEQFARRSAEAEAGRPVSEARAYELADRALTLATQARTLPQAVELMEEAVNVSARARDVYGTRLRSWRKGVLR